MGALPHDRHVGVVVDHHRELDHGHEPRADGRTDERGHVRRVVDHSVAVDHAGGTDTERTGLGMRRAQLAHPVRDLPDDAVERGRRRASSLVEDGAVTVDRADPDVGATEVDAEGDRARHRD